MSDRVNAILRALVSDPVDNLMIEELNSNHFEVSYEPTIDAETLKDKVKIFDVLVVRSRTKVTHEVLEKAERLKIIARAGIGTDNIDVSSAKEKGIHIVTAAGSSTQSVSELSIGLALSLTRKIPFLDRKSKENIWKKDTGTELYEKTAGIIGFGRIGYATAKVLKAMGLKVIAYDIYHNQKTMEEIGGSYVSLKDLLEKSDIIFLQATLTDGGAKLISKNELGMMKRGSYIVNTSRSEFIDGPSLLQALKDGKVAGYAADVTWNEPPNNEWENEIISLENVIITPHIGAQTVEAQKRVAKYTVENLIKKREEIGL
ncbi:NAD(P)-dependent oxidoreductase [Oxyplasma meridianum]|uniref:NAD(P)-dependent oxidoreductase n=1 Tax=Oxyplasma meridianum TaxID=3073602 RepID=A0AAX4NIY0_9ARCH